MSAWPKVKLGEVLTLCDNSVPSSELGEINLAGVYSFGRGLFRRGPMSPADTTYKYYNRLVTDDFVISQPKAWEGALARVTPDFDGWFLSPVFPTFRIERNRLDPSYLERFCKLESVWQELQRNSRGMGARRESISPDQFLSLDLPLPTLKEQRRVVARIEKLAAYLNEVNDLRVKIDSEVKALIIMMAHRDDLDDKAKSRLGWRKTFLSDVIALVDDLYVVNIDESYPNLGIYSFGRGLFHKQPIEGYLTSAKKLRKVKKGQFIYSRLFAFEGAYGTVTDDFDGYFVSTEYPTFECDYKQVIPEFLASYFMRPKAWQEIAIGSKGLGNRRQRVQPDQLLSHQLWLPPMAWQMKLSEVLSQLIRVQLSRTSSATDFDALMPSILDRAFKGELL